MATSTEVISRFAEAMAIQPSAVDRMLRPLRAAGLVPMGEKGRGKERGHYQAEHIVNLILAMAAEHHSRAADAVTALRPLVLKSVFPPERQPAFGNGNLGSALAQMLEQTNSDHIHLPMSLELCVDPLRADLKWGSENGSVAFGKADFYRPRLFTQAPPPYERPVIIYAMALLEISDLLRYEYPLTVSPSGSSAPNTAGSGNENAAPGRAASRRPRKRVAQPMNDPRRIIGILPLLKREKQHAVLGHPQMGALPFGEPNHEQHASSPSSAQARRPD